MFGTGLLLQKRAMSHTRSDPIRSDPILMLQLIGRALGRGIQPLLAGAKATESRGMLRVQRAPNTFLGGAAWGIQKDQEGFLKVDRDILMFLSRNQQDSGALHVQQQQ